MYKLSGCPSNQNYESLMRLKSLFGLDPTATTDYCKMHPLKNQRMILATDGNIGNTSSSTPRACKVTDFDLSLEPSNYYDDSKDIVHAPFLMEETFTTEFSLVCDEKYKVL